MQYTLTDKDIKCYHCGEPCRDEQIVLEDKVFCCNGCKLVYEMLNENNLCTYYDLDENPGASMKTPLFREKFNYLDDASVIRQLVDFSDAGRSRVTFYIPSMHCSSCIWLLEKIYKLNPAIVQSRVNFVKKEASFTYKDSEISLRELVELLASIGYEPQISLKDLEGKKEQKANHSLYLKIGVAGFAFGNSMLLNFPEYLDAGNSLTPQFKYIFGFLNIALSIPVLLYSASGYYISAYKGLRRRILNIDVPIALGITVLLGRSVFEIVTQSGPGYLDSFNGLIFFLLLGRLFQDKTYATLSFERDYKSYFPVSVTVREGDGSKVIPISRLAIGDVVLLRNQELIPADAMLMADSAAIDYSFVTGESTPVEKYKNEIVYAGGRLRGPATEVRIIKNVSQSYLTKLWNSDTFNKDEEHPLSDLSDKVARYFTLVVLVIATLAGIWWYQVEWHKAIDVISAILIVACPCALALSIPFTFGNVMRIFGRNKFYLKNAAAIEEMWGINHIVLDKTGTLTWQSKPHVACSFSPDEQQRALIRSLASQSLHPLSRFIADYFSRAEQKAVETFKEVPGKGIEGRIDGHEVRMGNKTFVAGDRNVAFPENSSVVFVSIDGEYLGYMTIKNKYRPGIEKFLLELSGHYKISLITGDNASEKDYLYNLFNKLNIKATMKFDQSPNDKREYILHLQDSGDKPLMIGDGLNDAGALKQSDLGISISEDINAFSPACDAILDAGRFTWLPRFLRYGRMGYRIVLISFAISFLYNIVGISFAVSGYLSPLVSAILMPLSSISVVVFATVAARFTARKMGF
ncbi:MAG TPA: HAD family hydrolase [Caldithrix abyssi]|uniref:HAD family hydrolase n=1 Tax=Caldithrix abyssi TaxID=187145 RepID=A0A7V5VFB5_CALAY|nr:HAD family hydrolase [Caldithrix abyssi]